MSYSHIDGEITITPNGGPNAGKKFVIQAFPKASFDAGSSRDVMGGRRERPIFTIVKAAKPKVSLEFSSAREHWRLFKFINPEATPVRGRSFTMAHIFTREGVGTAEWHFQGCSLPAMGYESGDSGVSSKVDFPCENALLGLSGAPPTTIYQDA